jgi:hypothetical protein
MSDEKKDGEKKKEEGAITKVAKGFTVVVAVLFIVAFGLMFVETLVELVLQAFAGILVAIQRGVSFINSAINGLRLAIGALGQNFFGIALIIFIYAVLIRAAVKLFLYGMKQLDEKK